MTSRRDVLKVAAGLATVSAAPFAHSAAKSKTLLILGGTGFIGPHLTDEAKRLGWTVTHFNRGKRDADGVPDVETLLGDRKGKLDSLEGRSGSWS
jgi:2'-hydroxyisoflavone reductase